MIIFYCQILLRFIIDMNCNWSPNIVFGLWRLSYSKAHLVKFKIKPWDPSLLWEFGSLGVLRKVCESDSKVHDSFLKHMVIAFCDIRFCLFGYVKKYAWGPVLLCLECIIKSGVPGQLFLEFCLNRFHGRTIKRFPFINHDWLFI